MATKRARYLAASSAGIVAMSLGLAACGSGDSGDAGATPLTIVYEDPTDHLDPQRIYVGADIASTSRLVYRQLLGFAADGKADAAIPDVATDTGKSLAGGKQWQFTVKDGVKWQDGSPVTCADFAYGASRNFASDLTGGPGYYLTARLDVKGEYPGPFKATPAQQEAFDKAITCEGSTITYNFKTPWADFPLAIASLHMMDPYQKSFDKGTKNDDVINSNGPYKVKDWDPKKGGTLVRNPEYDPATDTTELRKALPDTIAVKYGETEDALYQRLFSDAGDAKYTIAGQSRVPPSFYSKLDSVKDRYVQVESPYVDYLVPNQNVLKDPLVRQALAVSTNVTGWIAAGGGEKAYVPADSIVNPAVSGYKPNPSFADRNLAGDPAAAKALLKQAGVKTPYPIKFTYQQSDKADKQAAALKDTWDKAGFAVTLDPLGDEYYSKIQKPGSDSSVMWGGWGADWPSAITVTAPLFDSRQITKESNGQNYGNYKSAVADGLFDKAAAAATLEEQTKFLQDADAQLGKDTAYIPLEVAIFNWVYGSKVTGYANTPASNGFPEFAGMSVEK